MVTSSVCEHGVKWCAHQTELTATASTPGKKRDCKVVAEQQEPLRWASSLPKYLNQNNGRYQADTLRPEIQATLPLPERDKAHLLHFHMQQSCNTWGKVPTGRSPAAAPSLWQPSLQSLSNLFFTHAAPCRGVCRSSLPAVRRLTLRQLQSQGSLGRLLPFYFTAV